jgi:hypothetical protein
MIFAFPISTPVVHPCNLQILAFLLDVRCCAKDSGPGCVLELCTLWEPDLISEEYPASSGRVVSHLEKPCGSELEEI